MALENSQPTDARRVRSVSSGSALASARLGDLGRALFRYRGLALLAVGVLIASAMLPGPEVREDDGDELAQGVVATTPRVERPTTEAPVVSDSPIVVDDQPARAATIDPGSRFVTPRDDSSRFSRPEATAPSTEATSTVPDRSTTTTSAPAPLRIRASAWSTRTAGTPLASEGVPASSLPVGRRLGGDDKLSFFRLSGTATVLTLSLGPEEGQRAPDAAVVLACPVTTEWQPAEAMSFDDDPEYDCASPVTGQRQADGSWTFDLSAFPDRSGDKGFALVPSGDDPLGDWQVAFATRA